MTRKALSILASIPANAAGILAQDHEITAIATHEAAHLVAAISRGVTVREVWVKGSRGSGQASRTRNTDGRILALPNEDRDDAFYTYAGYAWEELHGDVGVAANDLYLADRLGHPSELEKSRQFVRKTEELIRHSAAALIVLRTSQGWLKGQKLLDLNYWIQCNLDDCVRVPIFSSHYMASHRFSMPWGGVRTP